MKALEVYRSVPRYLAARTLAGRIPWAAGTAPVRLADKAAPAAPEGWVRLRTRLSGICGSDLATVSGGSSLYFSPLVSLPFTPGHEVLAETLDDSPGLAAGSRVVLDPVLGCVARGLTPCPSCADGDSGRCARVTLGHVSPGLQTGFCADTGGGWSSELVAHPSQLYAVPDELPDERAVLTEPLACSVHVARRTACAAGASVLLVGGGAVGLLTLLAMRVLTDAGRITAVAKHPRQAALARELGADAVVRPDEAVRDVRRATGAVVLSPERGHDFLLGGVDVAVECTGTRAGLDLALRSTRAGGRVVLAGMPAGVDLTPVWFRELELVGAYATGRDDFATALRLLGDERLGALVTSFHPLGRWREALDEASSAGALGVTKVGFDLRTGAAA
ncbi:MAG: zinc-binding dehydrogenase [Mycobacteriales bacterium]